MSARRNSVSGLTDRQKKILRTVIESHISTGDPVGSKALLAGSDIAYSSATIRNEMAELEKLGYLEQLHTSSGRVPTSSGYRFYVDSLMEDYKLTASEILALNAMLKTKTRELDTILRSASKLVASLTNYTSLAIKGGTDEVTVKQYSYMYLSDNEFLLIMRMSDGTVKTGNVKTEAPMSDDMLIGLIASLNDIMAGVSPEQITLPMIMSLERKTGLDSGIVNAVIKTVYDAIGVTEKTDIEFSGVSKLLEYPEFKTTEQMKQIIGMIEDKDDILKLVSEADDDKVNICIGGDNDRGELTSKSGAYIQAGDGRAAKVVGR